MSTCPISFILLSISQSSVPFKFKSKPPIFMNASLLKNLTASITVAS
nr:hypothetical protein [Brachyspira hyodysenteriae]